MRNAEGIQQPQQPLHRMLPRRYVANLNNLPLCTVFVIVVVVVGGGGVVVIVDGGDGGGYDDDILQHHNCSYDDL